ncbi:MAG: mycofactocin biosynthesis chaperone MftB [Rhodospirillales bacterium]|nr:mycofactocin biosynthesis chaperone MftB [Rhodospirillales bacterium]
MNPSGCYQLANRVAIRSERFGGLIYNYQNRRLYFLHSRQLAEFLAGLSGKRSLADALDTFRQCQGLSQESGEAMLNSVRALEQMGIIVPVAQ